MKQISLFAAAAILALIVSGPAFAADAMSAAPAAPGKMMEEPKDQAVGAKMDKNTKMDDQKKMDSMKMDEKENGTGMKMEETHGMKMDDKK